MAVWVRRQLPKQGGSPSPVGNTPPSTQGHLRATTRTPHTTYSMALLCCGALRVSMSVVGNAYATWHLLHKWYPEDGSGSHPHLDTGLYPWMLHALLQATSKCGCCLLLVLLVHGRLMHPGLCRAFRISDGQQDMW